MSEPTINERMRTWTPARRPIVFVFIVGQGTMLSLAVTLFFLHKATSDSPFRSIPLPVFVLLEVFIFAFCVWMSIFCFLMLRLRGRMLVKTFLCENGRAVEKIEKAFQRKKLRFRRLSITGSLPRYPLSYVEVFTTHHDSVIIRVVRTKLEQQVGKLFHYTQLELGPVDPTTHGQVEEMKELLNEALEDS